MHQSSEQHDGFALNSAKQRLVGIMMQTRLKHTDTEEIVKNMQSAEVSMHCISMQDGAYMSSVSVTIVSGAESMVLTVCVMV